MIIIGLFVLLLARKSGSQEVAAPGECYTCSEGKFNGMRELQLWDAKANTHVTTKAYCKDGRTVFLKRMDGSVSFAHDWATYKTGFGTVAGEYWLGLDHLHLLTTNCGAQKLHAELATCNDTSGPVYEEYTRFQDTLSYDVFNDGVRDRYWVQQKGLAMGKSYSPVVADLYMGSWERDLKERAVQAGGAVVFALRYADDFLVAFRGDDDAVARWLEELNSKEAAIKVTLELEVDGQLPFLDIRIQRSQFGFRTSVYRKPCNTGQVVPFNSFTDPKYLQNAIAADVLRALKYCREEGVRREELRHIRAKFAAYGYPGSFIDAVVAKTFHAEEIKSRALPAPGAAPSQPRLAVPYFGPGFHALRREAGKLGIMLVAKPLSTVASGLCSRPKHRLPKEQMVDVVYLIKCSCDSIYIGESERELQTRVSEHRRGREKEDRGTAFGGHKACQPGPDFEGAQVLATESHYRLRLLLESAMIRWRGGRETVIRSPNDISLNRNAGALISERWLPLLRALPPPQSQN